MRGLEERLESEYSHRTSDEHAFRRVMQRLGEESGEKLVVFWSSKRDQQSGHVSKVALCVLDEICCSGNGHGEYELSLYREATIAAVSEGLHRVHPLARS